MTAPHEKEFRRATLALAADAKVQAALFPPFVCLGDELVLEWDNALRVIRGDGHQFTADADEAISALERRISAYSGQRNEGMFCDPAALREDPRWDEIRALAAAVCVAWGWRIEPPWPSGAIYVAERVEDD